jgi:hypothetical protein
MIGIIGILRSSIYLIYVIHGVAGELPTSGSLPIGKVGEVEKEFSARPLQISCASTCGSLPDLQSEREAGRWQGGWRVNAFVC